MRTINKSLIKAFLKSESLPQSYQETITNWYLPLVNRLLSQCQRRRSPLIVGITGAQGTGKSTVAKLLTKVLQDQKLQVVNLSLDDFYLSRKDRLLLSKQVHPLLATRGVPGTHNLELAMTLLKQLRARDSQGSLRIPVFDKALDEPEPETSWPTITLPVDVILIEGWLVGVTPQEAAALVAPVNDLEANEDEDGSWRLYVNQRLADYQPLFAAIDFLVMLEAPSFDCVYQWRGLQESKLAVARSDSHANKIMDEQTLRRFIQHFERLTRHGLATLPAQSDLIYHLDEQHHVTSMSQAIH